MTKPHNHSRRDFLYSAAGAGALLGSIPIGALRENVFAQAPSSTDPALGNLFPEVMAIAKAQRPGRAASRETLLAQLLYSPAPVALKPEVVERVDRGDHVREKVTFATSPTMRTSAYVLIPKAGSPPYPALVDLHSHGGMYVFGKEKVVDLGENHPAMIAYHDSNYDGRPTATELVRRGYVVISADAFFFGERRVRMKADEALGADRSKYDVETVKRLNQKCRAKEATLAKGLALAGATWPGVVAWDDMRTVDYLLSRPEVDPARIGCLGISMGGYRSMLLAALDDRIQAACVTGFMCTTQSMIESHLEIHSFVHFVSGLHRDLDWPQVADLHAPRALLVQQCSQDALFPLSGMKEAVRLIAAGYESAGAREQFTGKFYDVPHRFTRAMQDEAFDWLDERLKRS